MASSENQGLQIALIIFVMLTIILSVTTFLFFREYEEAVAQSLKDRETATTANAAATATQDEANALKQIIGLAPDAKLADVQTTHLEDMKNFAGTIPDDQKFYRQALEYVTKTLAEKEAQLVAAKNETIKVADERAAIEAAKETQVAAAKTAADQAGRDLAAAQAAFTEERDKKNQENQQLATNLEQKTQEAVEAADSAKKEKDKFASEASKREQILAQKNEVIDEMRATTFEVADGEVRWINQQSGSVWLNLGRADGLRRQITFSVFGADQVVGGDRKRKGSVEVTQILGEHFSEAKILDDEISDPIVPGDKVFTPLWHPGRNERFGIAGDIDLDKDGVDDRDMIRDLILMSGGEIDAEVDVTGKQTGNLDINTRYLVMGDEPENKAILDGGYTAIQREAQRLGVEILTIEKFLDHVGWKDQQQVLRFGRRGNAERRTPEIPDGGRVVAPGHVSDLFKKRNPRERKEKKEESAY